MTFSASGPKRLVYLVLAVAFLGATGGQAFGLRPCPRHDVLPGAGAPSAGATDRPPAEAASPGAPVDRSPSTRDHRPPGGLCTCLDDCHVGTSNLASVAGPGLTVDLPGAPVLSGLLLEESRLLGPRHRLFELHLPNAPPIPLS